MMVELPIATRSEANRRGHWARHYHRNSQQRSAVELAMRAHLGRPPQPPLTVRLTRISPRKLDSDNLAGALKHVRDGVADWLGIDDGDERIEWTVAQERRKPREQAVRIEVKG